MIAWLLISFLAGCRRNVPARIWCVVAVMKTLTPMDALVINIRDLRERRGWSQDDLARHLRCARQLVSHWESGRRTDRIALYWLVRLAEVFGVCVPDLFSVREAA